MSPHGGSPERSLPWSAHSSILAGGSVQGVGVVGGQLVPGRGALVPGRGVVAVRGTGPAASTAPVSFGRTAIVWPDLPARSRRAGRRDSVLVAEAVSLDEVVRLETGHVVEHATAWRVYEDAVVLVEVIRSVAPAGAGKRAVGPWQHRRAVTRLAVAAPRRRRGVVPVADDLSPRGYGGGVPTPDADAPSAWPYLPAVVRTNAERLVPEPTLWLGELAQRSEQGRPRAQELTVLRMSAERALVVVATRELVPMPEADVEAHVAAMARLPWLVEQVGLDLGDTVQRAPIGRRKG